MTREEDGKEEEEENEEEKEDERENGENESGEKEDEENEDGQDEEKEQEKSNVIPNTLCILGMVLVIWLVLNYVILAPGPPGTCTTYACQATAKLFLENMSNKTDPCEDFYDFACHNFDKEKKGPGLSDYYFDARDALVVELEDFLVTQLSDPVNFGGSEAVRYIGAIYAQAANRLLIPTNDFQKLSDLVKNIKNAGSIEDAIIITLKQGIPSLFRLEVGQSSSDREKRIIRISPPSLSLPLSSSEQIKLEYYNFIYQGLTLFKEKVDQVDSDQSQAIVEFESQLARYISQEINERDLELKDKSALGFIKQLDLTKVVTGIADIEKLEFFDEMYFEKMAKLVKSKPEETKHFLIWKACEFYGLLLSGSFINHLWQFTTARDGNSPSMAKLTVRRLIQSAPEFMGRFYIDKAEFNNKMKKKIGSMIDKLKKTTRKMIERSFWMDESSKKEAYKKLDGLLINIGYPDWIRENKKLDFLLEGVSKGEGESFDLVWSMEELLRAYRVKRLPKPFDPSKEWSFSPAQPEAAYTMRHNSITMTAAIFGGVLYDGHRPDYLNYAAMGPVFLSRIIRGFDDDGSEFGPEGNFNPWWSEETKEKYSIESQQMAEQYESTQDDKSKDYLNGVKTRNRDVADNFAIRAAYKAYFDQSHNEDLLPGFESWGAEKLFFLAYANSFCASYSPSKARSLIESAQFSLPKYRVNIPLSNMDEFSKAFACPANSKMNFATKRVVWS